jgi:GlpG protein
MRLIGELKDANLAKKFAAYLLTQGITPKVEPEADTWEIWVKEEDQLDAGLEELDRFLKEPDHERYRDSFERANQIARDEERKRRKFQKNVVKIGRRSAVRKRAPLTLLLIIISSLVALATNFGYADPERDVVFQALSFTSVGPPASREINEKYGGDFDNLNVRTASLQRGELWRLITPIFIHFGPLHIVFNMIWLFQFGYMVENRYGTFWMAVLVLATAAISNLVQSLVPAAVGGSIPMFYPSSGFLIASLGGMSGVVYGLFGFIWMKSIYDPNSGFRLPQSTVLVLIAWLFICIYLIPNVANWAHGVGLIVGMIGGYLPTMMGGSPVTRT